MFDFCLEESLLDTAKNVLILMQQILQARWYSSFDGSGDKSKSTDENDPFPFSIDARIMPSFNKLKMLKLNKEKAANSTKEIG